MPFPIPVRSTPLQSPIMGLPMPVQAEPSFRSNILKRKRPVQKQEIKPLFSFVI